MKVYEVQKELYDVQQKMLLQITPELVVREAELSNQYINLRNSEEALLNKNPELLGFP